MAVNEVPVIPGEILGVIEEFVPGKNVYVDEQNGTLRSKIRGKAIKNFTLHVVSVVSDKQVPLLKEGDIVYGFIDGVKDVIAFVKIFYIENRKRVLLRPLTGIIHVQNVSSDRVRTIYNAYSYGDIIRFKVAEEGGPPYVLSTIGREFGVILARCPQCMGILKKKGYSLFCPKCKVRVKKKVSLRYLR